MPLLKVITMVLLTVVASTFASDAFIEDSRASCLRSGGIFDCGKYKAAYLLSKIAATQRSFNIGPLRLVGIQTGNATEETILSRASSYSPQEPEFLKLFKYGVRQLGVFLQSHGLSLPLNGLGAGGPQLVYDDGTATNTLTDARGVHSKKKLAMLFPLMALFKFGIIKALLVPILLSLLFIKKVLIITTLVLPSILSNLKACKLVTPYHHGYLNAFYQPGVTGTGSDITSYGGQGGYDSYSKDWNANQRKTHWGQGQ